MPVEGYDHKHVWQYLFRPQPYSAPDRSYLGRDRQWEHDVVERLRRGDRIALSGVSTYDLFPSENVSCGSWESAEEHAKNADRSHAEFLSDEAIKARLDDRKRSKAAFEQAMSKARIKLEVQESELAREREEKAKIYAEREARRAAAEAVRLEALREERKARKEQDARRQATNALREAAWKRDREEQGIMHSRWECMVCGSPSLLEKENDGYRLTCMKCGKTAFGTHEQIVKVRQG